jgi:drug/metabolite transporter (DMT)-like permease
MIYGKGTVARVPQWSVNFYTFAIAAVFWSFFEPLPRILASCYTPAQWAMLLAIAVFSVLVPFALFYRGLELLPAWRAALTAMLEPVIAAVSAALFLGERLAAPQWAGAGLLLAGVGWVQWQERRAPGAGAAVPPPD